MIESLKITNGFAKKLNAFKNRKIMKFEPGLNVLFGPNGCGKTTAIKVISAYTGIVKEGWSRVPDPMVGGKKGYPECFSRITPGECYAELGWDGEPAFLFDGINQGNLPLNFDGFETPFTSFSEGISEYMSRPSSGMIIINRFSKLWPILKYPPDLTKPSERVSRYNDVWRDNEKDYIKYVKSLRNGKSTPTRITVLMDEVDHSLSIVNQRSLWKTIMPDLGKHFQIIVASHNIFSLNIEGANYIEFEKGYLKECTNILNTL